MNKLDSLVDLYFTDAGDFALGENGDLLDTKNYRLRALIQRLLTRICSNHGDWRLQPQLGANLQEFMGKRNTKETGDRIKARVQSEIINSNILRTNEFVVNVFPVTATSIAILVAITSNRPETVFTFTYDFRDNKVIPRKV